MLTRTPFNRRQTDLASGGVGILDEVAEEVQGSHSTNGVTSNTNGMEDLMASGGTIDAATSHESLNGAAAYLVFHSDGTGKGIVIVNSHLYLTFGNEGNYAKQVQVDYQ